MTNTNETPRVLVVGATGGTGRATVAALLRTGHRVTAFSRRASALLAEFEGEDLRTIDGDATDTEAVAAAVAGHDAVIVTLGIRENPLRVRLFGSARTPLDVRSAGTRNVVAAMRRHGVRRLVVLSSYGVGATRARLGLADRALFQLLLKPQIQDTEAQERVVHASDLEWVIAQPVHLTDEDTPERPFVSPAGNTRRMSVARSQVARFLVESVANPALNRATLALSG